MKRRTAGAGLCLAALLAGRGRLRLRATDESGDASKKRPPATKGQQTEHRGGTLTMLWNGVGSSIDTGLDYDANWQLLMMTTTACWPRSASRARRATRSCPTSPRRSRRHRRRQDLRVQAPQGHPVLERRGGQAERLQVHLPAPVQDRGPRLELLPGHHRRRRLREDAEALRPLRGHHRQRRRRHGHLPPREPDPDFLQKLAIPFAYVVPKGTPNKDTGTKPLPATGPYMI